VEGDPSSSTVGHSGAVPLLQEGVHAETLRLARDAVRAHVAGERRRRFAPLVHVGVPGRALSAPATLTRSDHALRCDTVAAMLARTGKGHLAWLTRPGELTTHDVDAAWSAAVAAAYAEAGRDLTWLVVTRRGWWDPRSDQRRTWQRVRV